jgi:hypothetical protein
VLKTEVPAKLSEQYPKERYNSLLPSETILGSVAPTHRVTIEVVNISPDPKDGDVYPLSNFGGNDNEFSLAKPAIDRLTGLAGVSFDEVIQVDDGTNPKKVKFRAVGYIKKPDGTKRYEVASYELDLENEENIVRKAMQKKADEKNWSEDRKRKWVESKVEDTMLRYQKHKVRRADTGARLACARQLLALKNKYTREELRNPFVVARIDFSPDLSDNEIKRLIIQQFAGSTRALYTGPTALTGPRVPSAVGKPEPETGGEVIDEEPGEDEHEKESMESEVRKLMVEEVITEAERAKIKAGLEQGMDEEGLKKGLKWLKNQIERRGAILRREKEEAKGEQLRMPWEKGE